MYLFKDNDEPQKILKPTQLNYICTEMAYFMVIVFTRYVSCVRRRYFVIYSSQEDSFFENLKQMKHRL